MFLLVVYSILLQPCNDNNNHKFPLERERKETRKKRSQVPNYATRYRWYADPGTIADRLPVMTKVTNGETSSHQHQHQHSQQSLTAAAPVVALTNSPVARPSVPSSIASSSPSMSAKSSDLLADLDFFTGAPAAPVPASTAFSPPRKMHSSIPQSISQPSFANFQNADFFFPGSFSFGILNLTPLSILWFFF